MTTTYCDIVKSIKPSCGLRAWWIRFVWHWLLPTDYECDVRVRLLRAQSSWIGENGEPKCAVTVREIAQQIRDMG